ncbi:uncharacterized protein LOC107794475 isoform X2 [Nicotiana tabacum]|nr:PREDICTED: uncharacterized protein LOC107794475 isoform X2 [Nicotiana tabacum]
MILLFLIMGKIYMIALPFLKLGLHQERVVNNIILPCIMLQAKVRFHLTLMSFQSFLFQDWPFFILVNLKYIGHTSKKMCVWNTNDLPNSPYRLKTVPNCKFCRAKRFQYESPGFCCDNGSVKLIHYGLPAKLLNLYLGNSEESKHFRTYVRLYNNMFAFTSLGVNYDRDLARRNCGIYMFRVQGKMYHFINDLVPSSQPAKNLQLYFYDTDNELANQMAFSDKLNESVIGTLMDALKVNPYSIFLKSLTDIPELSNFYIALKSDSGLDQRTYNLPTSSEVAAIWIEDESSSSIFLPHIRIYTHNSKSQLVNYYCGCYDPL